MDVKVLLVKVLGKENLFVVYAVFQNALSLAAMSDGHHLLTTLVVWRQGVSPKPGFVLKYTVPGRSRL